MLTHHLHPDRVAQVGLVRPVPQQRIPIRDARPVGSHPLPRRKFLEQPLDHRLHGGEHVFLLDKAHLHVKLVEIGGTAVGTRVFIAETRRNLEIAVKARHHDQLLELLGGLRQGIELARMQPRRHQKVARPFGRAGGDDRRLEFGKALIPHPVADRPHHVGPQHHVRMQLFPAQVQETVGQAGFFGVIHIAEHRQRQFICRAQHGQAGGINLDRARRQFRVDQRRVARLDPPVNPHHPFGAQLFNVGKGRAVAVGQHLGDAVMVAQVDKQHAAMVAHPVDPARKAHGLAHMGSIQVGTGMAAIGMHDRPLARKAVLSAPIQRARRGKSRELGTKGKPAGMPPQGRCSTNRHSGAPQAQQAVSVTVTSGSTRSANSRSNTATCQSQIGRAATSPRTTGLSAIPNTSGRRERMRNVPDPAKVHALRAIACRETCLPPGRSRQG